MSLSVTNPSYDRVYPMYAWRDNNVRLVLTQGEGATTLDGTAARIKAPRFQLRDDQGVMDLSGSPVISLALTRPDKSEDLLACTIIDATNGIISCPITASATAIAGQAVGEIRLSSTNGTIKFFGVHALIYDGVSNSAAAQSTQFSALVDALQKVATVDPDGSNTVALDSAIVENGTNPVASGVIKEYLEDDYLGFLTARFSRFKYAHETHSSTYDAETNPVDVYDDSSLEGVYIDNATELGTFYFIKNANSVRVGFLLCSNAGSSSYGATQIALYYSGAFLYRHKHSNSGEWDEWTSIELQKNKDSYNGEDTTFYGVSNDENKYPSSKSLYRFISDNAQTIVDIYKTIFDAAICNYRDVVPSQSETFSIYNDKVGTYLGNTSYTTEYDYTYVPNSVGDDKDLPNYKTISLPSDSYSITTTDTEAMTFKTEYVSGNTHTFWNLIPNRNYTYIVYKSDGSILDYGLVRATGQVRMINGSCGETDSYGGRPFNIRDLGGWSCDGGKIKYGKIFRGGELKGGIFESGTYVPKINVTNSQIKFFKDELGIRDEIDLRSDDEATAGGLQTPLGVGVDYLHIAFPFAHRAVLEDDSSSVAARATVIKRIAKDIKENRPVYIHCRQGADRTGIVCTFIEAICGVSQSDIDRDYELTSFARDYGVAGGSRIVRMRNQTESVLGRHKDFVTAVSSLEGSSFNNKIVRLLLRSGVTIDEINDIRFGLIDGSPSKLTNPYGDVSVSKTLSHVFIDNTSTSVVKYQPFEAVLTVEDMYDLSSVTLTMGGSNAASYYSNGRISIPVVTGNIVIVAEATQFEIVSEDMLKGNSVTRGKIHQNAVGTDEIENGKVTPSKLSFTAEKCVISDDIDSCVDDETVYQVRTTDANGVTGRHTVICVPATYQRTQYLFAQEGGIQFRKSLYNDDTWGSWSAWSKLITEDNVSTMVTNNTPKVMSVSIPTSGWSNNEYDITSLMPPSANANTRVDVSIGASVQEQLVADGCGGIYASTDTSNSITTFTLHAMYNKPTANITVQLTLTQLVSV